MEKRFDMILGKQRARARLREFIGKHLHSYKDARVLCLPGENGREIEMVYRKLGFRDENIVGIECDPAAAKGVRMHYPKITLLEGALSDVVTHLASGDLADQPFDVVSLDYCGNFSDDKVQPLQVLAIDRLLAGKAVVACNLFAGREGHTAQQALRSNHRGAELGRIADGNFGADLFFGSEHDQGAISTVARAVTDAEHTPLAGTRDDAVLHAIIWQITRAASWMKLQLDQGFRRHVPSGKPLRLAREMPVLQKAARARGFTKALTPLFLGCAQEELAHLLLEAASVVFPDSPESTRRHDAVVWSTNCTDSFLDKWGDGYVPVAAELYSYINDKGHRMCSDFVLFRRYDMNDWDDAFVLHEDGTLRVLTPEQFESPKDFLVYMMAVAERYLKLPQHHCDGPQPPRIDLGGGAIPMDSERVKAAIVRALQKGRSNDEILAKYPVTVGTLRALRAHVTMGTFA